MKKSEQRAIALGATRGEMRHRGYHPEHESSYSAVLLLDDMTRDEANKKLIAVIWAKSASKQQWKLFEQEWDAWKIKYTEDETFRKMVLARQYKAS